MVPLKKQTHICVLHRNKNVNYCNSFSKFAFNPLWGFTTTLFLISAYRNSSIYDTYIVLYCLRSNWTIHWQELPCFMSNQPCKRSRGGSTCSLEKSMQVNEDSLGWGKKINQKDSRNFRISQMNNVSDFWKEWMQWPENILRHVWLPTK